MYRYFITFLLFVMVSIACFADEEELKKQVQELIEQQQKMAEKLENHERQIENYELYVESLQQELESLKERVDESEEDDITAQLRQEVEDLIEETEGEVIEERTYGLLSRFIGSKYINLSGYYDFEFLVDSKDNSVTTFRAHHLTLYFQKRIYQFNFFAELEFEDAPIIEGDGVDVEARGEIVLEQSWAEWFYHPFLNIRGGLQLVPEYYNINHAPTFTISTLDPLHVAEIFPESFVGVSAYGDTLDFLGDDFGVGYFLYLGNGPSPNEGNTDINENKIVGGKLTLHLPRFKTLDTFDISSNLYSGRDDQDNKDFIWNFETILQVKNIVVLMEYAQGRKDFNDPNIQLQKSYGGYVELAYSFLRQYTVFARGEVFDQDRRNAERLKRIHVGFRYQPWPEISIKGQIFHEWNNDDDEEEFFGAAFSFVMLL